MVALTAGKSYNVGLSIHNTAKYDDGTPAPYSYTVKLSASYPGTTFLNVSQVVAFAADETKALTYLMAVPNIAANSGSVLAAINDASGNQVAAKSVDITIGNPYDIEFLSATYTASKITVTFRNNGITPSWGVGQSHIVSGGVVKSGTSNSHSLVIDLIYSVKLNTDYIDDWEGFHPAGSLLVVGYSVDIALPAIGASKTVSWTPVALTGRLVTYGAIDGAIVGYYSVANKIIFNQGVLYDNVSSGNQINGPVIITNALEVSRT